MSTRLALLVTDEERAELRRVVHQPGTRQALATRCKVILLDEQGITYAAIGARLDKREQTVLKWRGRFLTRRRASAKPAGVKGASLFSFVADQAPSDLSAWSFAGDTTENVHDIVVPPQTAAGAKVWLTAFWFNNRMESAPEASPSSTHVPGGLSIAA